MSNHKGVRFIVCVDNGGYDASLETWKIYETTQRNRAPMRG
jgi:hypothetical protein